MANYAQINFDNIVTQVITLDNSVSNGSDFLNNLFGGTLVQTSYNTYGGVHYTPNSSHQIPDGEPQLGYNYAGIGYNYDPVANSFYCQQPFPSWILNTQTYLWEAPIPYPTTGGPYYWDEQSQSWLPIKTPSQ